MTGCPSKLHISFAAEYFVYYCVILKLNFLIVNMERMVNVGKNFKKILSFILVMTIATGSFLFGGILTVNAAPVSLTVDISNIIQDDFLGANAVYHAYAYRADDNGREYDDTQREIEFNRIADMELGIARTYYDVDSAWYGGQWDWESPNMKALYKWMQAMKERGVDVALNTAWNFPGSVDGSSKWPLNPSPLAGANWNASVQNYAAWITETVRQIVEVHGFTNLKYLVLFTEPNNRTNKDNQNTTRTKWLDCVRAAHNSLVTADLRDNVKLVGPNEGSTASSDMVKWAADNANQYIDIYSSHNYQPKGKDLTGYNSYNDWYNWITTGMSKAASTDKPFWFDEYGTFDENQRLNNPWYGTTLATAQAAFMNAGAQSSLLWTLFDQQWPNDRAQRPADSFYDGVHKHGVAPSLRENAFPRESYYAFSMISKYMGAKGTKVYKTTNNGGVYTAASQTPDGDWSVLVVNTNNNEQDFALTFSGSINRDFNRHLYNPANSMADPTAEIIGTDKTLNVTNSISDALPAGGVAIYTTRGDSEPSIGDINADGKYDILDLLEVKSLMAAGATFEGKLLIAADLNKDGIVDEDDLGIFADIMLKDDDIENYLPVPYQPGPNRMTNPGFENGLAGYSVEANGGTADIVSDAYTGTSALRLIKGGNDGPRVHQYVDVKKHSEYSLSVWMKFGAAGAGKYSGQLRVATENWGEIKVIEPSPGDGWQKYTIRFNTGDNSKVIISVFNFGLDQYIDDFYLDGPDPEEPEYPNLMINPGFEDGQYWPSSIWPEYGSTNYGDISCLDVSGGQGNVHSGEHAIMIPANLGTNVTQVVEVKPNSDYTLSVWMKFSAAVGSGGRIQILGLDSAKYTEPAPSTEWQKYTISFNSGNSSEITVEIVTPGGGGLAKYIDDFYLDGPDPNELEPEEPEEPEYPNLMTNPDFETDGWWPAYGTDNGGNVARVSGGANDSGYALMLPAGTQYLSQDVDVKSNSDYTLSVWMKFSDSTGDGGQIRIEGPGYADIAFISPAPDTEWQKYTINFNSGSYTQITVKIFGNTSLDRYVDDFYLDGPGAGYPNLMTNPDFETDGWWPAYGTDNGGNVARVSGGANGSGYALMLPVGTQYLSQDIDVKSNSDYTLSVWMKFSDSTGDGGQIRIEGPGYADIAYISPAPDTGWQKHTITFNSGSYTQITVKIFGNTSLDRYVDDFYLDGPAPD